jgi:hypothetical protein
MCRNEAAKHHDNEAVAPAMPMPHSGEGAAR